MSYTLWLGDCLEEMDRIEAGSVDCILTDLPYGTTACAFDVRIPFEPLWKQYKRVIKKNGAVILFGRQPFTSILIMSNIKWFRQELVWDKLQSGGSFVLAKKKILSSHENILLFCDESPLYNPQMTQKPKHKIRPGKVNEKSGIAIPVGSGLVNSSSDWNPELSYPLSVLRYSATEAECNNYYRLHPNQKPVALMEYLIKTYTNEGDTVLDNTFGSCSTGEAALRTGRRFIGIEKDPDYFRIGQERMERITAELRGELTHLPMFAEATL